MTKEKTIDSGGYTHNPGSRVQCLSCLDIIQSMYRHDFKFCKCNNIAVDGGGEYLKISYTPGYEYEILDPELATDENQLKHWRDTKKKNNEQNSIH
tara:strand:+ start:288 stop:575 length:288 start_codon:yes stop_codon:yes gene_type:complete